MLDQQPARETAMDILTDLQALVLAPRSRHRSNSIYMQLFT